MSARDLVATPRGAGGGPDSPKESPDSLRSTQIAEVVDLLGEGEIGGLVNGLKSVYLDGVPIENPDGTRNFQNVEFHLLLGAPSQQPVDGFSQVEQEVAVGVQVTRATPATRTINDPDVSSVRVTINFPSLAETQDDGDVVGVSVEYAVEIQSNGGGFIERYRDTVTGKAVNGYKKSVVITLRDKGSAPWGVRVKRITPDSTSQYLQDQTWWESYTEIDALRMRYRHSAAAFMRLDARTFSHVPTRAFDAVGVSDWLIPSNYDPIARTTSGTWNGQFKAGWTNNPAWVYYNLVMNQRYGLGKYIPAADKWALYELAQWCDEPLDDGRGGLEPRYQINVQILQQVEALKLLQDIAAVFRGAVLYAGGQISAAWDAPGDPVAQYTPANVVGAVFNYADGSAKLKASVCTCWWNDQTQLGKRVPITWQDDALVAKYGYREMTPISPIGVTTPGQALRHAKWALYSQEYEDEVISFRVGSDGVAGRIGQVFQVSDPAETGERLGGRIKAATASQVELDGAVELLPGETYTLCVTQPDPADPTGLIVEERPVTTGVGTQAVLQVFPAFSAAPAAETVWVLSANTAKPTLWRYLAIEEVKAEDGGQGAAGGHTKPEYEITGIAHEPGKWDLIEQGLVVNKRPIRRLPDGATAPINLSLTEVVSNDGQTFKSQLVIGWEPTAPGLSYLVAWRLNAGAWNNVPATRAWSVDVELPALGLVEVQVRAQALTGDPSLPLEGSLTAVGNSHPAAEVAGLNLVNTSKGVVATWNRPGDFDWTTTELKLDGTSPETATYLADVAATTFNLGWPSDGLHTVWARNKRRGGPPSGWVYSQITYTGPAKLLDALDGRLTEEQFDAALQDRMDLIDGEGPGSVNARIKQFSLVGVNMVLGSGFDLDSSGDGLADYWGTFIAGSGDVARQYAVSLVAALNGGGKAQRVEVTSAGNTADGGLINLLPGGAIAAEPGVEMTISAWLRTTTAGVRVTARCRSATGTTLQDFSTPDCPVDGVAYRLSWTFTTPAGTADIRFLVRGLNATGKWVEADGAQLQTGPMAGPYMPNPADAAALSATVSAEAAARVDGDEALAASLTAVQAQVAANSAAITEETTARANADSAQASQISTLQAQMLTKGNNLLLNSSFELDTGGEGLADGWAAYSAGATGTVTRTQVAGRRYAEAQRCSAANLGTTANDRVGVSQVMAVTPAALAKAAASVYVKGTVGATGRMVLSTWAAGVQRSNTLVDVALSASWQRLTIVRESVAADVDELRLFVFAHTRAGGGAAEIDIDDAMVEPGNVVNDYAPGPGEVLGSYAGLMEERTARVSGDSALASQLTVVQAEVDDNSAAIVAEATARAAADSAQASQLNSVTARLNAKGANLVVNSSFELDSNGDGLGSNWNFYTAGTFGTAGSSLVAGRTTGKAQRRTASNLGSATTDRVGTWQQINVALGAFAAMKGSAYVRGTAGATGRLYVEARAGATIRGNTSATVALGSAWQRLVVDQPIAADVDNIRLYLWAQAKTGGGAVEIDFDDVLLEPGTELNEYSPGPGDAGGAYAAVIEERTARVAEDGELGAMWSIKVDANGRWAGMVTRAGADESSIDLLADVVRIGSTAFADEAMFVVYTTPQVIDGVTVPAGIYVRDLFFATLNGQKIIADSIDTQQLKVGSVTAASTVVDDYEGGAFSSVSFVQYIDGAIQTITSTGGVMVVGGIIRLDMTFSGTGVNHVWVSGTVTSVPSGLTLGSFGCRQPAVPNSTGGRMVSVELPISMLADLPAGENSIGVNMQVNFIGSTGSTVSASGGWSVAPRMWVTENKV